MYENENLTIDELKNSSVNKLQDNQYVKWDYSKTTSKYRNIFLNMTTKETQEEIKNGNIKTANLN